MGANTGSSIIGSIFVEGIYLTLFLIVFSNFGGVDLSVTAQLSPLIASGILFFVVFIIALIRDIKNYRKDG